MSGVRVNLLPREIQEREQARRRIGVIVAAAVAYLSVFVVIFFLLNGQVSDAEQRLAEAEAERDALSAEVNTLQPYAELEQRQDAASGVLTATMVGETSYAGILQDIAAVMPADSALTSVTVSTEAAGEPGLGAEGPALGTISGTGETLEGHAPGVERFLLEFDKIAAFFQVYVSSSTIDEEDIATFSFEANLGPEIVTGRYADGLPESLR